LAAFAVLRSASAFAQSSYLDGRTLEVLAGGSDGSAANQIMQYFANALSRTLPNTQIVFRANTGGSTALNAALVAESPPDGLLIGTIEGQAILSQAMGEDVYGPMDVALVGAVGRATDVLFATNQSGITSIEDLIASREPAILPVRSTASSSYFQALLLNAYLGTRIQPVTGYDNGARHLAFRTGEAQLGIFGPSGARQIAVDQLGVPILVGNELPLGPEIGEVRPLTTVPGDPDYAWIVHLFDLMSIASLLAAAKATPPDRLAVLRAAFLAAAICRRGGTAHRHHPNQRRGTRCAHVRVPEQCRFIG
jgi:hypothetical protein